MIKELNHETHEKERKIKLIVKSNWNKIKKQLNREVKRIHRAQRKVDFFNPLKKSNYPQAIFPSTQCSETYC